MTVQAVTLQAAEWFIDSDPGEGSGTAFTGFSGETASLDLTIPAGTINVLSEGAHLIGVRFQDSDGVWGHVVWRSFLNQHPHNGLAEGEYFFNTDPGYGAGLALVGVAGNSHNVDHTVSVASLPAGANLLGVRFRDGDGEWGQTSFRVFLNPEAGSRALNRLEFVVYRSGSPVFSGSLLGDGSLAINLSHRPSDLTPVDAETLLFEIQAIDESGRRSHKVFREVAVQDFTQDFLDTFFTAEEQADLEVSGDDADIDRDGLATLIEQATGLNPREFDSPGDVATLGAEDDATVFCFRAAAAPEFEAATSTFTLGDLRFEVEASDDLATWRRATSPADFTVDTSTLSNPDGSVLQKLTQNTTGKSALSLRLKVARQ